VRIKYKAGMILKRKNALAMFYLITDVMDDNVTLMGLSTLATFKTSKVSDYWDVISEAFCE
jgi:hypothetical protein